MHNLQVVKGFKPGDHLNEVTPNLLLWHLCTLPLVLVDLRLEITSICQVHHYAE